MMRGFYMEPRCIVVVVPCFRKPSGARFFAVRCVGNTHHIWMGGKGGGGQTDKKNSFGFRKTLT